jgi:predicted transcriptional regulator
MLKETKERPNVGVRLPREVFEKLEDLEKSTGSSRSDLLNEAIAVYLGFPVAAVPDRLNRIESRLDKVLSRLGWMYE